MSGDDDFEDRLRVQLRHAAGDAPVAGSLAPRRRVHRSAAAVAPVVVALVVVGAGAGWWALDRPTGSPRAGGSVAATSAPTTTAATSASPSVEPATGRGRDCPAMTVRFAGRTYAVTAGRPTVGRVLGWGRTVGAGACSSGRVRVRVVVGSDPRDVVAVRGASGWTAYARVVR